MKTMKTKERLREVYKVKLFNLLYGTDFKTYDGDDYTKNNGIPLAEHLEGTDLKTLLKDEPIIYANIRRISPNGMNRDISFYAIVNNEIVDITYFMSWIIDERECKQDKYGRNIIRVSGVGMDMAFHCVYTLGGILFDNVFYNPPKISPFSNENVKIDGGYLLDYRII